MRSRIGVSLALAALLVVGLTARVGARCASRDLALVSLTRLDAPIPVGGSIVLALGPASARGASAGAPVTVTIGTHGMGGGALTMIETLAPGLYRVPLAGMPAGRHSLRGLWPAERDFTLATGPLPAPPPAPDVASIEVSHRGRAGTSALAVLRAAMPSSVVALIVEGASGPIGYAIPSGTRTSLSPFGRCDRRPDGARHPSGGEAIRLRAVDALGRVSAPSSPRAAVER